MSDGKAAPSSAGHAVASVSVEAASARPSPAAAAASSPAAQAPKQNGAAAAPPASPQPTALVQQCWTAAFDYNSHRWYFCNTATGQTQWDPPAGWLPPPAPPVPVRPLLHPAHAAAMAAAAHAAAAHHLALATSSSQAAAAASDPSSGGSITSSQPAGAVQAPATAPATAAAAAAPNMAPAAPAEPGYYYQDAYGAMQGPFPKEQLLEWRGALPMDLQVTYRPGRGQPPHSLELAKVLGDGELLARWRGDNPAKASIPGSAPPADEFEKELAAGGGYSAYAAAALAGLPASDDAVQVARLAAFSGRSIQELLSFNYGSGGIGDYTVTALHSRGRGTVQAADAQVEGLYDEMGRWVDASTMEEQLARAAEQRKKGLSGKELQALRARKTEMKRKKQIEWLMR